MGRAYIGIAGWSYEDWEGIVYPARRPRGFHPLPFLARSIDIVEVNSTFYRLPTSALTMTWVRKTSATPGFLFSIKLHQVFTHERASYGPADVEAFKRGIEPLVAAGRLAALLLQFPWSFANTEAHRDYLAALFRLFAGYPLALEVRHGSWDDPAALRFLREREVALCNIDQPVIGSSLRPAAVVTRPDFSYVRLHGRNYADWFRRDAGRDERYDYLYAEGELEEWVGRIKRLVGESDRVYVITNNHYRGQALANALQIKNMLTGEKLVVPAGLVKQYPVLEEIVRKIREGQLDLFGPGEPEPPGQRGKPGGRA